MPWANLQLADAVLWTARLLGFALLLQSIELLQLRRAFVDSAVFAWSILRQEQRAFPAPLRALFVLILPYGPFVGLLWLRVVLSLLLTLGLLWTAPLLLVTQLLVCARFRGTFNGGSDYMSVVVLLGLSGATLFSASMALAKASLAYVCVQLVFSYFIAGVVKCVRPEWRSGDALTTLLASKRYGVSWLATSLVEPAELTKLASLAVLSFECTFPVALLSPRLALIWLGAGALFHAANALIFGLNRFFFAWIAAYPSLIFFSAELWRTHVG